MLNYNSTKEIKATYIAPNLGKAVNVLASALSSTISAKVAYDREQEIKAKQTKLEQEREARKQEKLRQQMLASKATDIKHLYTLELQDTLNNEELQGNAKLQAIKKLRDKYLGQLAEVGKDGTSKIVRDMYYSLEEDSTRLLYQVKKIEKEKIKKQLTENLMKDISSGTITKFSEANEWAKKQNLGIDENKLKEAFIRGRTRKAVEYIQQSLIDGIPNELLRFNSLEDIKKTFYKGVDISEVPSQVISAIAQAHRWKLSEIDKRNREALADERARLSAQRQAVNRALLNLQGEVERSNKNGLGVDPKVSNSLNILNGVADDKQRDKISELNKQIIDNKVVTTTIDKGIEKGYSKQEILNSLSQYETLSKKGKEALINSVWNRKIGELEHQLDVAINTNNINAVGETLDKFYKLDIDEARKTVNDIVHQKLNLLNVGTLDSNINLLRTWIEAERNAGNPTPILERKLLNELENTKLLLGTSESKQDLSNYLFTKRRDYFEAKRSKFKKELGERIGTIKAYLKDKWLEFDNYTNDRELRNFILDNPQIPKDKLGEAFERNAIDIDTTNKVFKDWGKFRLSDSMANGKIIIPNDRDLGEDSISPFLKQYIPEHSDEFMDFVISKTKENLKDLEVQYAGKFEEIEDFYFTIVKTPHGLQLQAYGTPKGWDSEELLGVINHDELKDYLNKVGR